MDKESSARAPSAGSSKVLVALDGSPAAATALPAARALAKQIGATVEVLHVAPQAATESEVRQLLRLGQEAIRLRLEVGDAVVGILHAMDDPQVALVVLTTHGRSIEPGRVLGGVADGVATRTSRPILLVRPEATVQPSPTGVVLRRLLVPLDGTPTTAAGLIPATSLAGQLGASVDILFVAHPQQAPAAERGSIAAPRYVDQPQHEWPQWMNEVSSRLWSCLAECPADVPVRVHLAHGDIGEEIARFASEHGTDAIVLVRRSHLERGRGRVLRAVLDHTPCPVLLVAAVP